VCRYMRRSTAQNCRKQPNPFRNAIVDLAITIEANLSRLEDFPRRERNGG
jgi:hypothetical protein